MDEAIPGDPEAAESAAVRCPPERVLACFPGAPQFRCYPVIMYVTGSAQGSSTSSIARATLLISDDQYPLRISTQRACSCPTASVQSSPSQRGDQAHVPTTCLDKHRPAGSRRKAVG